MSANQFEFFNEGEAKDAKTHQGINSQLPK